VIAMLLTPFGTPFDISVIVGVLLSVVAVVLSHRRRPAAQDDTPARADGAVRTKEDS
jgi:hypothetical protein